MCLRPLPLHLLPSVYLFSLKFLKLFHLFFWFGGHAQRCSWLFPYFALKNHSYGLKWTNVMLRMKPESAKFKANALLNVLLRHQPPSNCFPPCTSLSFLYSMVKHNLHIISHIDTLFPSYYYYQIYRNNTIIFFQ